MFEFHVIDASKSAISWGEITRKLASLYNQGWEKEEFDLKSKIFLLKKKINTTPASVPQENQVTLAEEDTDDNQSTLTLILP